MSSNTSIDFSKLPAPNVVEPLDYETILADMKVKLVEIDPSYNALVESDTGIKILEAVAYYVLILRARINEAAKAVMLPYATGADLDNLAALHGVERLQISPGDANALPPIAPTFETDAAFRARVQLSLEGFSTAGPIGAYIFHAKRVPEVRDVSVKGPPTKPAGEVHVCVLTHTGDGTPDANVLAAVDRILNDEIIRPVTDKVFVNAAIVRRYSIRAKLYTYEGPDPLIAIDEARSRLNAYITDMHKLGNDVTKSGLYAALHVPGVQRVEIEEPTASLVIPWNETAFCPPENITITHAGTDQ